MQAILLSLGTLLLAVAGVVFTAMNWSRLDATAQGLVLLALTMAVGASTALAARRGLPATAEALGLVTVVLSLVDAHAARVSVWPDVGLAGFWAGALAVVAAIAWWLAAASGIRSTALVAVVMAQVPLLLVLGETGAGATKAGLALLAQTAVVSALIASSSAGRRLDPTTRAFALTPAVATWTFTTGASALWLLLDGARENAGLVAVVAVAAAVAIQAALSWPHHDGVRSLALFAATTTGLAASAWAIRLLAEPHTTSALLAVVTAGAAALGVRLAPRWGSVPAGVATWTGALVASALLSPIDLVVSRLIEVSGVPWELAAVDRAVAGHLAIGRSSPATIAIHLVGMLAMLAAWVPKVGRGSSALGALVVGIGAVALAPVMLPLSVGGAAAVAWIGAVLVVAGVEARFRTVDGDEQRAKRILGVGCGASAALLVLGSWWSMASSALSVVGTAIVIATAVWALARGWWVQHLGIARLATGLAVLAVGVEAAIVAAIAGTATVTAFACAGAAGLAAAAICLLVLPARLSAAAELAGWYLHGMALMAVVAAVDGTTVGGPDGSSGVALDAALRITLLSGALAACGRAARGRAVHFAALGASEALALWWIELAVVGVQAPEPYTLPLAVVLAAAGAVAGRRAAGTARGPGSWVTAGPALLVAAVPTVWLSLLEPGGPRPLLALVAGMAVLATGAFAGRRALVDVGAGTVGVLGLARLLPVLADAPNWLTIGLTGAVLVGVGATFEQRRQDARGVRDRYSALR